MTETARAFWIAEPGRGEIRDEPLPQAGPDDVTVRTLWSGISRGTEALVFGGKVPPSEWDRMRAPFQAGTFPAPVKYGYASVGVVEEGPDRLQGRSVFALYPHQTRYRIPATAVHPVPDTVPTARAVLAANLETAVNGVWDAALNVGDRVAVIGGGTIGCLVAWLAAAVPGCEVELVDLNPDRAEIARAMGARFATPETAAGDADVVVHASGGPTGLALALRLAGIEARIVEMSWYGDAAVTVPLGEAFHARRLTIAASQVGRIPPDHRARWSTQRRMQLVLALLQCQALDTLITGESDFEDLPTVMSSLAEHPGGALCHRIRYAQESD